MDAAKGGRSEEDSRETGLARAHVGVLWAERGRKIERKALYLSARFHRNDWAFARQQSDGHEQASLDTGAPRRERARSERRRVPPTRYNGLYILDEPEAALSPSRELSLLVAMHALVEQGCQFPDRR
ncbi:MAG: hypothetical protein EOP08_16890, partial [Proteobacteria bacterium]